MGKILNKTLGQLFAELGFAPKSQKQKQLDAAEELLRIVKPDQKYPLEFVCFRITGYRPKQTDEQSVKGRELAHDLGAFVTSVSGELALGAAQQEQKIYTLEELASHLNVSTKTIHRWRKKGLMGRTFVFNGKQKKIGFSQPAVDAFLGDNPEVIEKAGQFSQLNEKEKTGIIQWATELDSVGALSRYRIIKTISAETQRSAETIRCILVDHEKKNRNKSIFKKPAGTIRPKDAALLYKMYQNGSGVAELMAKFHRTRSSIYRIINKRKAKSLLAHKIEFIDSGEFLKENASQKILAKGPESAPNHPGRQEQASLLNRQQEIKLFRRYNYLKYLACLTQTRINTSRPSGTRLSRIDEYLAQAEKIKKTIIEANLWLVVNIAGKHLAGSVNMQDLISEGNFSLMRAVEKFDYTRGYRFSTYASWAIAKDFARSIPAEAARPDRHTTSDMSNIPQEMRTGDVADTVAAEHAHRSLEQIIKDNLTEREQYVVRNHFGLDGSKIKKQKAQTLNQIGETLGLTKERIRQIELAALQKLRHNLSAEEFDLLTG